MSKWDLSQDFKVGLAVRNQSNASYLQAKEKNHVIISVGIEEASDKIQHQVIKLSAIYE